MLVLVVLLICCANLSGLFLARAAALLPLYRRMIARMNSMPGIVSASVAEIPPLFEVGDGGRFVAADAGPKAQAVGTFANAVGGDFSRQLGRRLLRGGICGHAAGAAGGLD
jgi:hypothetical protein